MKLNPFKKPASRQRRRQSAQRSSTPNVMRYGGGRSSEHSRNTGRRQKPDHTIDLSEKKRRFITITLSLVILAAGIYTMLLGGAPRVRIDEVSNGIARKDTAVYDYGVRQIWGGSLNNYTKLTAQTDRVQTEVLRQFPELQNATVELPVIGRSPLVTLKPGIAVAKLTNTTGSFFIASDGKVLAKVDGNYIYNGQRELIQIVDQSGLEPTAGEYVLNSDQVTAIQTYVSGFRQYNQSVKQVVLPPIINEVDIVLKNTDYVIKFSLLEDPRQSLGAFQAVRGEFTKLTKPSLYVDVRVPEKVFYK